MPTANRGDIRPLDSVRDSLGSIVCRAVSYAFQSAALGVEHLAEAAHLSPRQFSRAFRAETSHPIDAIADQTGFADRERMRRAFLRAFGQPPQAIRRLAQAA